MTASYRIQIEAQDRITYKHHYMTPAQAKWFTQLVLLKTGQDTPERAAWRILWKTVNTRQDFDNAIAALKALPVYVDPSYVAPAPVVFATEVGLYFDPATETHYRVIEVKRDGKTKISQHRLVKINADRLTTEGETVKLEWVWVNRYVIHADWKVDTQKELDFSIQYKYCTKCWRGLKAAKSVAKAVGPVCAKKFGL